MSLTTTTIDRDGKKVMASTYVTHLPHADFSTMLANSSPLSWPRCLPSFWDKVIPNGVTEDGWQRIIEHVHWGPFRMRVPLVWKQTVIDDSYRLEYQIDPHFVDPRRVDRWVTVDEGYAYVHKVGNGVDITATKALHFRGTSARLMAFWMPGVMNLEPMMDEFFTNQATLALPEGWTPFPDMTGVTRNEW